MAGECRRSGCRFGRKRDARGRGWKPYCSWGCQRWGEFRKGVTSGAYADPMGRREVEARLRTIGVLLDIRIDPDDALPNNSFLFLGEHCRELRTSNQSPE